MKKINSVSQSKNASAYKKLLCWFFVLMSIFSCMIFSACGDKYKNLRINISSNGELIEELKFIIDPSQEYATQRIGIEFAGIDKEDVGQVKVYSEPYELIVDTNYVYNGNMCYVDLLPIMPSSGGAKLIVSHLASKTTKEIDLSIVKKSNDVEILNSKYIISIPEEGEVEHVVDFSQVLRLMPDSMAPGVGTDDVYFKLNGSLPAGVDIVDAELAEVPGLLKGFKVSSSVIESSLHIYPVTYMEGVAEVEDKYKDIKDIEIFFKKTLSDKNVELLQKENIDVDLKNLTLISNDLLLNTFKLTLKHGETPLVETEFFEMYELEVNSHDSQKISVFIESNNDIVLIANIDSTELIQVDVILRPINYVGDIQPIKKSIFVRAALKADDIKVSKNGQEISSDDNINIFDYYEEGNSLGTLFTFEPITNNGNAVHNDLNKMKVVINPEILSEKNSSQTSGDLEETFGVYLNSRLYSLEIHIFNEFLMFEYDENKQAMVSQEFDKNARIYVKYIAGGGANEVANFGFSVENINKSSLENWKTVALVNVDLNFNRLKGVKSMSVAAGQYHYDETAGKGVYEQQGNNDPQVVYLNRLQGLDDNSTSNIYYLQIVNMSVLGVDNAKIQNAEFEVEIKPSFATNNALTLYAEGADRLKAIENNADRNEEGFKNVVYSYAIGSAEKVVCFVFRKDTDLGEYVITFYQEGVTKYTLKCVVYEDLTAIERDYVYFEEGSKAFENIKYKDIYPEADYVVASGQDLNISIDLHDAVLNSQVVKGYAYSFVIGNEQSGALETIDADDYGKYFEIVHENYGFNNAQLSFIKGTSIASTIEYVYLKIAVHTKYFINIVEEVTETYNTDEIVIKFFIYDEITAEDISINHTSMTRYFEDYLSVYHKDKSKATLEINMQDSLWDYVTLNEDNAAVEWVTSEPGSFTANGKSANVNFSSKLGDSYIFTVRAYVMQFDNIFELQCVFNVEKPVLTERVRINSEINTYETENDSYYINLKHGETYQVIAQNYSSKAQVTHPETIVQVFDENGSAFIAKDYFEVDQANGRITVKKVDGAHSFKFVVFAKDSLQYIPSFDKSGYNNPSSFMMKFTGPDEGLCDNAFFVADILLSDGTEENPYLIKTAKDFWEIDDEDAFKIANYKLMANISLHNYSETNSKIYGFEGTIVTDANNIFTMDAITLDNDHLNLFEGFKGNISNIKFVVKYDYSLNRPASNLGVFDKNLGTLNDVGVVVSGSAHFIANTQYNFGCLVGTNNAVITYSKTFGVDGFINLSGSSTVAFGGLVGKNCAQIIGCENSVNSGEDEIVLNTVGGRADALSQLSIVSTLSNANSMIGGVVGLNSKEGFDEEKTIGTIHNAFVQVEINAANTSNIGGVIGKNVQDEVSINFKKSDKGYISYVENLLIEDWKKIAVYNVKSASIIKAKDNVGGIVGYDSNGVYIDCDYQILSSNNKMAAIQANNNVGGIAGYSLYGKFAYCSVMSYCWNYAGLKTDLSTVITDTADIVASDYVGGIVGFAHSSTDLTSIEIEGSAISDKVVVVYSSVNAYLQATKEYNGGYVGNIGGILSGGKTHTTEYKAIIFNAYFIGALEGNVYYVQQMTGSGATAKTHYLALDNNGWAEYNIVYSLNLEKTNYAVNAKMGHVADGSEFNVANNYITNGSWNPARDFWWGNANINGGYLFITPDVSGENRLPIFDLAPEAIDVTVKNESNEDLKRILMLDYFNFSQNEMLTDEQLNELNSIYNKNKYIYKIEKDEKTGLPINVGVLDIKASPTGIGAVVVNIKSTNTNVVDITFDGRILINGVGECELIFSSVLNPNAGAIENRTIKVVVDYPIGDSFAISTSKTDIAQIVNGKTLNIAQDTSKQMYVITSGSKAEDFDEDGIKEHYAYRTKNNVHLKIYLSSVAAVEIEDYISISGQTGSSVALDNKTPFIISVLKKCEDGVFNVNVKPYTMVEDIYVDLDGMAQFTLSTKEGASNITFSYDEAIVYPNDTIYLSANFVTDDPFTDANINDIYDFIETKNNDKYKYIKSGNEYTIMRVGKNGDVDTVIGCFRIYVDDYSKFENNVQTIRFRIEFMDITLTEEATLRIDAVVADECLDKVVYTIIPQRIDKIEIKNYYNLIEYELDAEGKIALDENGNKKVLYSNWIHDDILKPDNAGKIIVDIAPNNGYYSYLEISDITGDEEILFIQVDENGNALSLIHDPSSDNKGIKLYHYEGQVKSRIYILTQIDKNFSSKVHTIEIRAYSNSGALLKRQTKEIDVKMLPDIIVEYKLPDGTVGGTIQASESSSRSFYLANGVDAEFTITTKNANSDLEYSISAFKGDSENTSLANKYEFANIVGNHYILKRKADQEISIDDIGCKVRIDFRTYAYLDNGDFNMAECFVEFEIAAYVIHGVSVNNSIDNMDTREIYGYIGKPVKLEFYFDKDDISYYDIESVGEKFWDSVYEYQPGLEDDASSATLREIYSILKELNDYDDKDNDYLVLNRNEVDREQIHGYKQLVNPEKIYLSFNNILVDEGYDKKINANNEEEDDPKYLAVEFRLNRDDNYKWTIGRFSPSPASNTYAIVKNYKLNFKNATAWYEPTVVHDEQDFLEMTSGGRYILAKDLVLQDYVPLDVNLLEFDGNGRTITIESFGLFNDEEIKAGLFRRVYDGMIVKNVVLKYQSVDDKGNWTFGLIDNKGSVSVRTDLCNNPSVNYTSLQFGGIAAINDGVITNCSVEGVIAVNASTIEQKKFASGDNYGINFFIGGMVAENGSTGYITNSTSELSIYAQANIGGFVHTNNGKIASCGVDKSTTIYTYNAGLDKTIVVNVAGFAVENENQISLSYVDLTVGSMSAKDVSAGFVYTNSGSISDSYVNIEKTGINNNTFSGFVYSNSGSITRAYTHINDGTKVNNNDTMFAPAGTTGLQQCIEFMVLKHGYSHGIEEGLSTLEIAKRYNKSYYQELGFAFGDNETAVWKIDPNEMPKLVSTQEKVVFNGSDPYAGLLPLSGRVEIDEETGEEKIIYTPNFAYYGTRENPYIISDLETWNSFFTNDTTAYYRIVKDIDFASLGNNPETSKLTFKGNIQGNNMRLDNIMLYSTSTLNALGLFRDMSSAKDKNIQNSVRNLTLTTTSVWASRTSSVGLLAGMVEDFNLYNITIDAENVIMVGGNAVGGLAGLVRGDFDIDQISSNIGANSTRASTQYNYSIYMSKNNKKEISSNLDSVYYAGSVVGILDGYSANNYNINDKRNVEDPYFMVRNINVAGDIAVIGDTVGGAFGFVGERVYVNNVKVDISGMLAGVQYSAGMVGENRGIIDNNGIKIVIADHMFEESAAVSSGVVGFNLGGLIRNAQVQAKIHKSGYGKIVGGVVGRNIYGTINSVVVDGELSGYFTGGIVGVSYTNNMLINASTGSGTITSECKANNTTLIPGSVVEYHENGTLIKTYGNVAVTKATMEYLLKSSSEYYSYKNNTEGENTLANTTVKYKVLGLIVGMGYEDSVVDKIELTDTEAALYPGFDNRYTISLTDDAIVFNVEYNDISEMQQMFGNIQYIVEETDVLLKDDSVDANDVVCKLKDFNWLTLSEGKDYVMYLVGSNVSTFDSWFNSYSDQFLIVKSKIEDKQA